MATILLLNNDRELAEKARKIAVGWDIQFGDEFTEVDEKGGPDIVATAGYGRTIGKIIEKAPNLRWVQTWSAGVDAIPLDVLKAHSVHLTNASGVHPKPISESIFGFILSISRGITQSYELQLQKTWRPGLGTGFDLREVHGSSIGILGAGAIGSETAKIAKAFDMRTLGFARSETPREYFDLVTSDLSAVLGQSDIVVNILPLTATTRHIIGKAEFAQMKKDSIYITVGRGPTTDFTALSEALTNGVIGAAGVDVTEPEPIPDGDPLWSVPNLVITPHISGSTQYYQERASEIFLENLKAYIETGKPVRNIVDLDAGY